MFLTFFIWYSDGRVPDPTACHASPLSWKNEKRLEHLKRIESPRYFCTGKHVCRNVFNTNKEKSTWDYNEQKQQLLWTWG